MEAGKGDGQAPFGEEWNPQITVRQYKFTGKERDDESNLDNFGARYLASSYGRFTTPDWSSKPEGVPYVDLSDPQSLNLYSYVRNNPLTHTDADGHADCGTWLCRFILDVGTGNFGLAAMVLHDSVQRGNYARAAAELSGEGASEGRKALQASTYEKLSPIGKAVTDSAKNTRVDQLAGKTAAELAESASRTNATMNALGTGGKVLGGAGVALAVGSVAVDTVNAPKGQKLDAALNGSGRLGGSLAGAWGGAEIGSAAGPWGAAGGALIGGFAGDATVHSLEVGHPLDPETRLELEVLP